VLRDAKRRGVDVTVETCPQYLLLSTEDHKRLGKRAARQYPPIREAPATREALWQALREGVVDMIATDHAPTLARGEDARPASGNATCGFPGVETQMPLMLTEVSKRPDVAQRLRALGLRQSGEGLGPVPETRGVIQPGAGCRHRAG